MHVSRTVRLLPSLILILPLLLAGCDDPTPGLVDTPAPGDPSDSFAKSGVRSVHGAAIDGDQVLIVGRGSTDSWMLQLDGDLAERRFVHTLPPGVAGVCAHPVEGWLVAGGIAGDDDPDGWVAHVDLAGEVTWTTTLEMPVVVDLTPLDDRGVVVLGEQPAINGGLAWELISPDGQQVWARTLDSNGADRAVAVVEKGDGGVAIAGSWNGSVFGTGEASLWYTDGDGAVVGGRISPPEQGLQLADVIHMGSGALVVSGWQTGAGGRLWLQILDSGRNWLSGAHYGTASIQGVNRAIRLTSDKLLTVGWDGHETSNERDVFISLHDLANADRNSSRHGNDITNETAVDAVKLSSSQVLIVGDRYREGDSTVEILAMSVQL